MREGAAQNGSEIGVPHNAEKSYFTMTDLCHSVSKDPQGRRQKKRHREKERSDRESEKNVAYNQARVVINQIVGSVMSLSACLGNHLRRLNVRFISIYPIPLRLRVDATPTNQRAH